MAVVGAGLRGAGGGPHPSEGPCGVDAVVRGAHRVSGQAGPADQRRVLQWAWTFLTGQRGLAVDCQGRRAGAGGRHAGAGDVECTACALIRCVKTRTRGCADTVRLPSASRAPPFAHAIWIGLCARTLAFVRRTSEMATAPIVAAPRAEIEPTINPLKAAWRRFGTPAARRADGARDRAHASRATGTRGKADASSR